MSPANGDQRLPVLYFPIEHIQRELDGKLLLALEAVRRGYQVVVGEHERLNRRLKQLPRGAYLYKDAASWQAAKLFPKLQAAGHKTLALDEEGLIFRSEQAYLRDRVDAQAIAHLDILFAWGELQHRVLLDKENINPDILCTVGNPRMDLCRLSASTPAPGKKFVVLVNTRFSSVNGHKSSEQLLDSLRRMSVIREPADETFYAAFIQRDIPLLQEFIQATRDIAALDDAIQVIVRPHPSESSERYQRAFADYKNITVDNQAPLTQHLHDADIILHEGCTTAIEAALMGKPSVALELTPPLSAPLALPNSFSQICVTREQAVAAIANAWRSGHSSAPDIGEQARAALKNATGPYAFELILDAIDALSLNRSPSSLLHDALAHGQRIKDLRLTLKHWLYLKWLPRLLGKQPADISKRAASFANKYAKFPLLDLTSFKQRADAVIALYPHPVSMEIARIDSQTFLLTPGK